VRVGEYSNYLFSFVLTAVIHRHVKTLESKSQLLDTALASEEEANRRWEECRALIEQARVEIDALRVALAQAQSLGSGAPQTNNNVGEG
jgi:exonuclease VII small subunit